ncbi:type VI secretion system baseplate subunit TssF [Serratia sp. UGAL515B_01]|uniref:type VI secretion system baseplate subunit TssF n=1 Tax=Serratia sp. UGAL515B_01 TaxID=2986763 RepID=UPI0029541B26|nr:type VI secretion system baseplate subunit TssF [Serratia sp. UGAL515B_01]WON77457.1 type VI secretion system baseplate subunit TssF [Serratia sp. UGAL515B_01]
MLSERFLALYNEELRYLREDGQRFAQMHPQVAQHLGLHVDGVLDPFVERLLEGTAFLSSRIQERLNNEHPEFALQMLGRLAPLWYTPLPSIATIAMVPDLTSPQWHSHVTLPKGSRVTLSDHSLNNQRAIFSTGRDLKIQPVLIEHVECTNTPPANLPHAVAHQLRDGHAHLALRLGTQGVASLSELDLAPLNLTLAGDIVHSNQVMTTLLNNTLRIVVWAKTDDRPLIKVLDKEQLRQGGLNDDEALLPTHISELPGSRLLREYFAAPSRFFSLELHGLNDFLQQGDRIHAFEILFVLDLRPLHLIDRVTSQDFRLFATPIINLYKRRCSPVLINNQHIEYPVIVDNVNPRLYEIHHILKVNGLLTDGSNAPFSALHGHGRFGDDDNLGGYSIRRRRELRENNSQKVSPMPHDSLFISLSPGNTGLDIDRVKSLSVEAMVCDRYLIPSQLQQLQFQLDVALPIGPIEMLRSPSRPQGVPDIAQAWQALQLLANNPLRYARPEVADCSALLKDWLSLFCQSGEISQHKRITSLSHASINHTFERYTVPGPIAWGRGVEVTIDLSSHHHSDKGAFLFARVMHHALSEYCELGQNLRMHLKVDGETFAQWEPISHV